MSDDYRRMVAIDFDGVIHSYVTPWTGPCDISDPPVAGAIDFLTHLVWETDYDVGIFSARNHEPGATVAIKKWLRDEITKECGIREAANECVDEIEILQIKPSRAFIMIDDRSWRFNGTFPSDQELATFKPWYK